MVGCMGWQVALGSIGAVGLPFKGLWAGPLGKLREGSMQEEAGAWAGGFPTTGSGQAQHDWLERWGGYSSRGRGRRWLLCGSGSISTVKQACRISSPTALRKAKSRMCWHRPEKTDPAEMDHVSLSGRLLVDVTFG